MSPDRRRSRGELGEAIAATHLERRGYRIVARNVRTRRGELDLIAAGREALVFCEVKTRVAGSARGPKTPLDAVGPDKQRRLRSLALEWLATTAERPHREKLRFDAIGVTIDADGRLLALEHLEGAF